MKKIIFMITIVLSMQSMAAEKYICIYKNFEIKMITHESEDVQLEVFKGKTKVSACHLKVLSFEVGQSKLTNDKLLRFEKGDCNIIYNKIASGVEIIEKGFVKIPIKGKFSYAYLVKNEQPLKCLLKQ